MVKAQLDVESLDNLANQCFNDLNTNLEANLMAKAAPIFIERRGRPSWLIPLIKDLKIDDLVEVEQDLSGQKLKTTRSNLSIWGKRHAKKFTLKMATNGRYYIQRISTSKKARKSAKSSRRI